MKKHIILLLAIVGMLASCSGNKFKVDGKVDGATDTVKFVLEASSNGRWFIIDTITPKADGKFEISEDAPEFPNIYRLRYNSQSVYFPIDSLDHITVNTSLKGFATDFDIKGSDNAVKIMKIDKEALKFAEGGASSEALKKWKHDLAEQIVTDPAGIVAYYIINKYIGDKPLFDPLNDDDLRIIGAVANSYNTFKPNDPRTDYLVNLLLDGQRRRREAHNDVDTVQAHVAKLLNITLQDYNGVNHDLLKESQKGKVIVLNFTVYQASFSPAFNKVLNDVYQKYHAKGLEIFQVSLDSDPVAWRQAAKNLPWITVYDPMGQQSKNVLAYNVTGVPTVFIIDRNGEVAQRVGDVTQLPTIVAKYL